MKNLNKDNKKVKQARIKNEIYNSEDKVYIVKNTIMDGVQEEGPRFSTILENFKESSNSNNSDKSSKFPKYKTSNLKSNILLSARDENTNIMKVYKSNRSSIISEESEKIDKDSENSNKNNLEVTNTNHTNTNITNGEYLNTEDKLILEENKSNRNSEGSSVIKKISKENNINKYSNKYNNNVSYNNRHVKNGDDENEEGEEDEENDSDRIKKNDSFKVNNLSDTLKHSISKNSGKIDVQNILIESLRNGEHVYYCLNMLDSINKSVLNVKAAE